MIYKKIRNYIMDNEGFRSKPYKCTSGKLTIGYGRNIEDVGITKDEASYMLDQDIMSLNLRLYKINSFKELSNERKIAVIDMAYNLGYNGIKSFKKMWKAIGNKEYELAADEIMRSEYAKQVKDRANSNAIIMFTGKIKEIK